jgi:YrbI family 3-deoxy-D-manno-octulosonate 8-phosphate phosphatase
MDELFGAVRALSVDIDGTLTDGRTTWLGPDVGWTQTYSVRDGEAILRLKAAGVLVIPMSRNRTLCARVRMEHLGLPTDWLGLADKLTGLKAAASQYGIALENVCHVGDGKDDVPLLAAVGIGCVVRDAHPDAVAAAKFVLERGGGDRAVEELEERIMRGRSHES